MKRELNGEITLAFEYCEVMINGVIVSDFVSDFDGQNTKLNYYISNTPIDTNNEAIERMLITYYNGICEADSTYCYGSSWTGVYGRNDEFKVGGHDIIKELQDKVGKYCYLKIETK